MANDATTDDVTTDVTTTDDATVDDASAGVPSEQPRLTSEERLRALAGDRRRKARKGAPLPVDLTRRPGDLVDPVRERSRDTGRDQP